MSMDILPLGEMIILFSRIGLIRGEDGQPEVTRIHPNLLFAGGARRHGGRYTPMERPDMLYLRVLGHSNTGGTGNAFGQRS